MNICICDLNGVCESVCKYQRTQFECSFPRLSDYIKYKLNEKEEEEKKKREK